MAGIYIHIPFCKQRCHYCDFYKTTQVLKKPELVEAILQELKMRKPFLEGEKVETIYFGGGTPSLLSQDELRKILDTVFENYDMAAHPEITLESNPDDLTKEKLQELKQSPVQRLSIGIQSFQNEQLVKMNRRHNANQAVECVMNAQDAGFDNISTDLIYGLPDLSPKVWEQDLLQMAKLNIQHLSAYHLTYEPGTVYDTMLKKGALKPILEDDSLTQFKMLIDWSNAENFEHYEISNFAKNGFYSKHNTSYWQQKKYLGIGPSAHSYNLDHRSWNVANLNKYLLGISNQKPAYESEVLSKIDRYNEYLMTTLRTQWGISLKRVEEDFGTDKLVSLKQQITPFVEKGQVKISYDHVVLSESGIFISDAILTDLMYVE